MTSTIFLVLWLVTLNAFFELRGSFEDNATIIISEKTYKIFEVKDSKNAGSKMLDSEQTGSYYLRKIKSFIQNE